MRFNMKKNKLLKTLLSSQTLILVFITILSACTPKYISDYDEYTDRAITSLQREFETFFVTLDSLVDRDKCEWINHSSFYHSSKINISSVQVRVKAITKNKKTIEQVVLLSNSLKSLEKLHKLGCFSNEQIENLRSNFNSSFTAILKLELAKKRIQ